MKNIEHNLNFLHNVFLSLFFYVINYIRSFCQKTKQPTLKEEDFIPACTSNNVEKLKQLTTKFKLDLNQGLTEAVKANSYNVIEYLISQGANNLDENLKFACSNNNFGISELLVQKGAKTVVGLRVAKSPNIIKMLYRHEQNSELINY